MAKGQLSLEYLIILAAFFSFLLFLLPYLNIVYHLGIFSSDVRNAENFLSGFTNSVNSLSILGEGSEQSINARILTTWEIYSQGKELIVLVKDNELGREKKVSAELNSDILMEKMEKEGNLNLKLTKNDGRILVKSAS